MTHDCPSAFAQPVLVFFCLAFAISLVLWGLATVAPDTALATFCFCGGGFALPQLEDASLPFLATLILGLLWASRHIALIRITDGGIQAFILSCTELFNVGITRISITTPAVW